MRIGIEHSLTARHGLSAFGCTAGVIALAHLGACARETEESCGIMAVNQLRDYLKHRNSIDIVNFRCVSMR